MEKMKFTFLPPHVQKAHRFGLTHVDMQEVIEYLDTYDQLSLLHDSDDNSQWAYACRGLLCAAIVAYCRPFSDNKSRGFATERLGPKTFDATREQRALHDLLVEKRNTFIAHADWKARNVTYYVKNAESVSWNFPHPNVWEGFDVRDFRRLVERVRQECIDRGFEAAQSAT